MKLKLQIEELKLLHQRELITKEQDIKLQFEKIHQQVIGSFAKKDEHHEELQ